MYISNRSGIQCRDHPNQEYANYCSSINCLKPLCPDCVQIHTKLHDKQQIQSWKNCLVKQKGILSFTLNELRKIEQQQKRFLPTKSIQQIIEENLKTLRLIKDKMCKIVEECFLSYEQQLVTLIRKSYNVDAPDTSKLKMAIQELVKLSEKLDSKGKVVIEGLKMSHQLDHHHLLNFFQQLRKRQRKIVNEIFVIENQDIYSKLKHTLQNQLTFSKLNNYSTSKNSPYNTKKNPNSSENRNLFETLKINADNYFKNKYLHFFIPSSNQLKVLPIEQAERKNFNWKSIQFAGSKLLPCYFKSIITPDGNIYLTGGSYNDSRSNEIFHYNYEKNTLDLVAKMKYQRSSHSICYLGGLIYVIGGFSNVQNDVTRSCEVFNTLEQKCYDIAPLIAPSANSCAVPFGNEYIFKIGGIENKTQGNSLIQMYSIKKNKWTLVKIESEEPQMHLLSFSAGVQINNDEILVFGGYDNTEFQNPKRTCYSLIVNLEKPSVRVKNQTIPPLPFAEGFWNNNPVVHNGRVYAIQNINDPQDELTAIADEKRVVIFDGDMWMY